MLDGKQTACQLRYLQFHVLDFMSGVESVEIDGGVN